MHFKLPSRNNQQAMRNLLLSLLIVNVVFQPFSEHDATTHWHDAETELNREINIQPRLFLEAIRHRQVWPPQFRSRSSSSASLKREPRAQMATAQLKTCGHLLLLNWHLICQRELGEDWREFIQIKGTGRSNWFEGTSRSSDLRHVLFPIKIRFCSFIDKCDAWLDREVNEEWGWETQPRRWWTDPELNDPDLYFEHISWIM